MRFHRLSLCIWFLFHRNHTHFCPVVFLLTSSSFCPCCAHICTLALALILPPLGEACVCVYPLESQGSFWIVLAFSFSFAAGGLVVHASTSPTKRLALNTDIGGDAHRRTCNCPFPDGMRLSPEPHSADKYDRRHPVASSSI